MPLTLHRLSSHSDPVRGDIVVCLSPDDGNRLIKRVVGVPGDQIEVRQNQIWINGEAANVF